MQVEFYGGSMDGKIMEVADTQQIFFVGDENGIAEEQYIRFPDDNKFRIVVNFKGL